ncbi:MAG: hypothetical protein JO182_05810 [Acidobacteriaceae bacterium]|nr:hypothetical protein [Acidobacteriaceae bacterium]MBV9033990.1 hypothetical protein [Acidobacteriaceae bacterium]MBV9227632.1 hypothetical protein [Acidobacteriaceae bacterium]MBV9305748.1 hypothetical protein [Acidobacteriaceae bacterium]MBV9939480.1 hypothetical protein [Acidobacteriaceae bacterium]
MKKLLGTSILIGTLAVAGFGQVNTQRENQQDRVAQGVRSGQLTPGETANLENQERALNGEIRADRQANGGNLTSAERAQINGQQNGLSKQIYADKHNAASDHFGNGKIGQRKENQQDRIAQGIQSGRLNAGQTANLENREANINRTIHADRAANGGKLTNAERNSVNRQQNRVSRSIYRDKH